MITDQAFELDLFKMALSVAFEQVQRASLCFCLRFWVDSSAAAREACNY